MSNPVDTQDGGLAARAKALEATLDDIKQGSEVKLIAVVQGAAAAKPAADVKPWYERFDWMFTLLGWLFTLLGPLLMFFVGYYVKDKVEIDLKKQELELSSAQAVQALVLQLANPDTKAADRDAVIITMASFGTVATPRLIHQLRIRDDSQGNAVMEGFRVIAADDRPDTCNALQMVIGENWVLFPWWSHKRAATLLGELQCEGAQQALETYAKMLPGKDPNDATTLDAASVQVYLRKVHADKATPTSDVQSIVTEVTAALEKLPKGSP